MADKHKTEDLQIALENGTLNVETVHPKAGEVFKSNQLAEINWFFTMLANKMGLNGKSSVTRLEESPPELLVDGEMVEMPNSIVLPPQQLFVYRGKSKNGEETEFSHNKFLPGMPFELTVVTTKTVTAKAKGGRGLTPEMLSKPFGEDVRAAMDTAGIDNLNGVTAVSERVRVLTLARVEWFPGIFEGSGTTYQISRIIRSETTRVVTFAGLDAEHVLPIKPVVTKQSLPDTQSKIPAIQFVDRSSKEAKPTLDLDKLFADMPELNPVIASQAVLIPVDELELTDQRPQLTKELKVGFKPEPVEEPEVEPEPKVEPQLEPVEEPKVEPEPEEESKPESTFSAQDLQRMFDQLNSQVSEPIREEFSESTWQPEQVIPQLESVQNIPKAEEYQTTIVSQPVLEAVEVPSAAVQPQIEWQYTSPSRVSDRMVDDILGDLDVLVSESHSLSRQKQPLPVSVQSKAVHNFFRLGKKHKK